MPDDAIPAAKPKLLDQVRNAIRRKHYSLRTEETYVHWVKRFIYFSGKRHPAGLGEPEVTAFLNHLAVVRDVAASTQNQALSALLFLYREVLVQPLPWLDGLERAKRPARMPDDDLHARDEQGRARGAQSSRRPAGSRGATACRLLQRMSLWICC